MSSFLTPELTRSAIISPGEVSLLCLLARPTFDIEGTEGATALTQLRQSDIDWSNFVLMARAHRLMPLISQRLTQYGTQIIPEKVLKELKASFHINAIKNQRLTRELLRIVDLLNSHDIPTVSFKGPTLAASCYKSLSLREFGDLDILVHPHHFFEAKDLITKDGYQRAVTLKGIQDVTQQESELMSNWGEFTLRHPNGQFFIDLHGRLIAGEFPLLSADFGSFWERLVSVPLLKRNVSVFCTEDLLIYLCIHGCKDLWKRLSWVCDIAMLIHHHPALDWQAVLARSQSLECERMLWLGLSLSQALFHSPLPQDVINYKKSTFKQTRLVSQVSQQLRSGVYPAAIGYTPNQRAYFHGRLIANKQDRHNHYKTHLKHSLVSQFKPNVNDKLFLKLPRPLYFLYYIIRPFRLLIQGKGNS